MVVLKENAKMINFKIINILGTPTTPNGIEVLQNNIVLMQFGLKRKPVEIQNRPLDRGIKKLSIDEQQKQVITGQTTSSNESTSMNEV